MKQFKIVTQVGEMTIEIKVTSDKIFDTLGIEAKKVEMAMCAIIGEKLVAIGGKDSRPVSWDS